MDNANLSCPNCGVPFSTENAQSDSQECTCADCGHQWTPDAECTVQDAECTAPLAVNPETAGHKFSFAMLASQPLDVRRLLNQVTEDWGNLAKYGDLVKFRQKYDMPAGIGRDSEVKVSNFKSAKAAYEALQGEDVIGLVVLIDDKPSMALWAYEGRASGKYRLRTTAEFERLVASASLAIDTSYSIFTTSKAYAALNAINKEFKDRWSADVIMVDQARKALQQQRAANRSGHAYYHSFSRRSSRTSSFMHHPSSDDFKHMAQRALSIRLAKFKADKNPSIDSPAQLRKLINTSGYLQTIKVGGYVYELQSSNLSIPAIAKRTKIGQTDDSDSSVAVKYSYSDRLNSKDYYSHYDRGSSQQIPPREFIVYLKLQGGSIVPGDVKAAAGSYDARSHTDVPQEESKVRQLLSSVLAEV